MDRITKQLLTDFLKAQEVEATKESDDFEDFCNYTVVSNEYNKTFDINTISTGAGSTVGWGDARNPNVIAGISWVSFLNPTYRAGRNDNKINLLNANMLSSYHYK